MLGFSFNLAQWTSVTSIPGISTDPAAAIYRYFLGRYDGEALLCEMPPHRHCPSLPASGCAFWEREREADDEIHQGHCG